MRLTFAGCGSAFTVADDNYQSNILLTVSKSDAKSEKDPETDRHFLIDCGTDIRYSLRRIGLQKATDIDAVFVTHTHADHIGGLEWLALNCRYGAIRRRPRLIVPEELADRLWNNSLSGGLMVTEDGPATLETYFDVMAVPQGQDFVWEDTSFKIIPIVHVDGGTVCMMSYGLFFLTNGLRVYISSDAKFDETLSTRPYILRADIIFHDCETGPRSGVHSHYEDLCRLPAEVKNKIWLYHYSPGALPDAVADGFRGFVSRGQVFDFAQPATLFAKA